MRVQEIIRRPLITEKSTVLRDEKNIIAFEVHRDANRIEVKRAVEAQFKVKVADVRIARVHGKVRRQGRFVGRRPDWKKAYVRLVEGDVQLAPFRADATIVHYDFSRRSQIPLVRITTFWGTPRRYDVGTAAHM